MGTALKFDDGRRLSREALAALSDAAQETVRRMEEAGAFVRAAEARRVRSCVWAGQSIEERMFGEDAFPFSGASDLRVRTADRTVRLRVAECVTALLRAQPSFGASELSPAAARYLSELWRRTMQGDFELSWHVQMALLSLYLWGGGRSAAGLWIGWENVQEWTPREYSAPELVQALVEGGVGDPDAAAIVLADPEQLADVAAALGL
ncbi:MAG: hypothetical protein IJ678_06080, partial [Kiritimatiellae bacterium]|nr:hypothetical protein [Kiritimatiellia bacterium]